MEHYALRAKKTATAKNIILLHVAHFLTVGNRVFSRVADFYIVVYVKRYFLLFFRNIGCQRVGAGGKARGAEGAGAVWRISWTGGWYMAGCATGWFIFMTANMAPIINAV